MNGTALIATALGIVVTLAFTRSRIWIRARSDRLVQLYTWLFGVDALIWLLGTAIYIVAPGLFTKLLGSASHFQTMMLAMLAGCFVVLVTVGIKATR